MNTFDVCPVAFDGTVVGKIGLRGMTDTMQDGNSLSFRAHRSWSTYGEYYGVHAGFDDEAPFTFTAHSPARTASGTTGTPGKATAVTGSSRTA